MIAPDRPTFSSPLAIPVAWEVLPSAPTRAALEARERSNSASLNLLLQQIDLAAAPRPADEELAETLLPVRLKLDLVITLLARLSYRDVRLPETHEIEIGLSRMSWTVPLPLAIGAWLAITLYFSDVFREPIVLDGEVVRCVDNIADGGWHIEVRFPEMSEAVGESLARLVFLEHRRRRARQPARAAG